ncbi:MAG: serine hydrolase [Bacteroidota bacterium]
MKILVFTLSLIFSLIFLQHTAFAQRIPESIKQNIRARIDNGENKNIIIGIVDEKGKQYYSYGYVSEKAKVAPKKYTLYEIGSVSKVFTGLALAMADTEGKLSINDPLAKYLPEGVQLKDYEGKPILMKHLSNHQSGLPRLPDNMPFSDPQNPYYDYDKNLLWEFLNGHELRRAPEAEYEYSNLAVGLLGTLLADQKGKSYDELIFEEISSKLDMKDTRVSLNEDQKLRLSPGHDGNKAVKNWDLNVLEGAGAIRSSASDLLSFLMYQMEMYPSPLTAAMKLGQKGTMALENEKDSVALGWHIKHGENSKIIWHNGQTGGYHSFLGFDKTQKKGVVVLSNSTVSIDDIGLHYLDPANPLKKIKEIIKLGVETLEQYVGTYQLSPGVDVFIRRNNLQLTAQVTGQGEFEIYPESENRFFLRVVDAAVEFNKDDKGNVESFTLFQNGLEQIAKRTSDETPKVEKNERVEIELTEEQIEKYDGSYVLAPGVEFTVTHKGNQLYVKLTGQASFPVYAVSETRFFYKIVDAELEFEVNDKGEATALTLFQNGAKQKAKRKE